MSSYLQYGGKIPRIYLLEYDSYRAWAQYLCPYDTTTQTAFATSGTVPKLLKFDEASMLLQGCQC